MTRRKSLVPPLVFLLCLVVLVVVPLAYGLQYPRSVGSVFDDVVTFGRLSALVGFMSDLGITLWMAMAALMAHAFHRRMEMETPVPSEEYWFYLCSIFVLLFLALDDRLLIHEWLNEQHGVSRRLIIAVYGTGVLGAGFRFRAYLLGKQQVWLWVALAAFVFSEIVDLNLLDGFINHFLSADNQDVLEESAKWIGICALFLHVFTLTTNLPVKRPA